MKIIPKDFWDKKILQWEESRYEKRSSYNLLEKIAVIGSESLRFRLGFIKNILKENVHGKKVIELGCGSGLLAKDLLDAGAASYIGVDISTSAISIARQRIEKNGLSNKASFIDADISDLSVQKGDLIFSLGFLDWLSDDQIRSVFSICPSTDFLHSFAEKKNNLNQLLHRLYVHIAYGYRTGSYKPRYFEAMDLISIAKEYYAIPVHIIRHKRLSFGAIITTLAIK